LGAINLDLSLFNVSFGALELGLGSFSLGFGALELNLGAFNLSLGAFELGLHLLLTGTERGLPLGQCRKDGFYAIESFNTGSHRSDGVN
jgi:hypothetical protein